MNNESLFDILMKPLGLADRRPIRNKKCPLCGEKRLCWWEHTVQKYCMGIECLNPDCNSFCIGINQNYREMLKKFCNPDSDVIFANTETAKAFRNKK